MTGGRHRVSLPRRSAARKNHLLSPCRAGQVTLPSVSQENRRWTSARGPCRTRSGLRACESTPPPNPLPGAERGSKTDTTPVVAIPCGFWPPLPEAERGRGGEGLLHNLSVRLLPFFEASGPEKLGKPGAFPLFQHPVRPGVLKKSRPYGRSPGNLGSSGCPKRAEVELRRASACWARAGGGRRKSTTATGNGSGGWTAAELRAGLPDAVGGGGDQAGLQHHRDPEHHPERPLEGLVAEQHHAEVGPQGAAGQRQPVQHHLRHA